MASTTSAIATKILKSASKSKSGAANNTHFFFVEGGEGNHVLKIWYCCKQNHKINLKMSTPL
jgi:hypothetical protein